MKPSPFDYHCAKSVEDAIAALAAHGDGAMLLAGGQSLVPMMNLGLVTPEVLIDITRLSDLAYVRLDEDVLRIGALATHNTVMRAEDSARACPLLVSAYDNVAHHTIRNRGTLGGNVCHADPASEMPLVLTLLDATMVIHGVDGGRIVAAGDFFVDAFETAIATGEMLTEIRVPAQAAGEGYAFEEMSQRKGDFAIVSAGCRLSIEGGRMTNVRFGLTGAGAQNRRMTVLETMLEGAVWEARLLSDAVEVAVVNADPSDDIHADVAYKLDLVRAMSRRVLAAAVEMAVK
ncbi:MAG: xanthine dehydrogenase family protein subunit M [Mesorhizobium sp.]|uniref:FAD binding domain-containing protein n=1 Tax=Mesorhizobium sp. TaxID=1871066 RepID=UPI000FEAA520|nr:xanthine dehydrogenase family protein subunit M [Mesorhizobium sp.]RWI57123.1 MAG: xanthine dehydrogenase family protein subunit M [Mesorhizobium sp.]